MATSYLCLFLQKYQVSFSMLEIYNEQVRDLLVKNNPKGGLQVRLKGRHVCSLSSFLCNQPDEFLQHEAKVFVN